MRAMSAAGVARPADCTGSATVRQLVPASLAVVVLATTASGCFLWHSPEGSPPGPRPVPFSDAGSRARDAGAGLPRPPVREDAGRPLLGPDAGPLMCPLVRADASCLSSFLVQPGAAFDLPLTFDTCGCCAASECRVEVTSIEGAPTLRLETTLCPDPCDCDACYVPVVHCAVPALAEGAWNVVVNGAPAFSLPVFPDSGLLPPPPACATFAEPDTCSRSEAPLDPSGWRPSAVCVDTRRPDETAIVVSSDCWSCGDLLGPCVATLEPRVTDDLPPGGEILLAPTHFPTQCDVDCPAICIPAEQRCVVPPLVPGHFYRVHADGEVMLTFTAGEPGPSC